MERDPEIDDITALSPHAEHKRLVNISRQRRWTEQEAAREQRDREYRERRLSRIESAVDTAFDKYPLIQREHLALVIRDVISELFPDEPFHR